MERKLFPDPPLQFILSTPPGTAAVVDEPPLFTRDVGCSPAASATAGEAN